MVSKYHFTNHAPAKFTELEKGTVLSNKDLWLVYGKMARNWLFHLEGRKTVKIVMVMVGIEMQLARERTTITHLSP